MKIKNLLIFLIIFIQKIYSIPIAIDYLSDGKKNIILISDFHIDDEYLGIVIQNGKLGLAKQGLGGIRYDHNLDQNALKKILIQKNLSILDNKHVINDAMKSLLDRLLMMDRKNNSFDIFWEAANDNLIEDSTSFNFMHFAVPYLNKNLKNARIIPADNLRDIKFNDKSESLGFFIGSFVGYLMAPSFVRPEFNSKEWLKPFRDFFGGLEKLRVIVKEKRQSLNKEFSWICNDLENYFARYIDPYKNLNDTQFINEMKKLYNDDQFKKAFCKDMMGGIADFEMLDGMLASNKKTSILYAGGGHCENIKEALLKHNFKLIFSKNNCISQNYKVTNVCLLVYYLAKLAYYKLAYKITNNLLYETYNISGLVHKSLVPTDFDVIIVAVNKKI